MFSNDLNSFTSAGLGEASHDLDIIKNFQFITLAPDMDKIRAILPGMGMAHHRRILNSL